MTGKQELKAARRMGNRYLRKADRFKSLRAMGPAREARAKALDYYATAAAIIAAHKAGE